MLHCSASFSSLSLSLCLSLVRSCARVSFSSWSNRWIEGNSMHINVLNIIDVTFHQLAFSFSFSFFLFLLRLRRLCFICFSSFLSSVFLIIFCLLLPSNVTARTRKKNVGQATVCAQYAKREKQSDKKMQIEQESALTRALLHSFSFSLSPVLLLAFFFVTSDCCVVVHHHHRHPTLTLTLTLTLYLSIYVSLFLSVSFSLSFSFCYSRVYTLGYFSFSQKHR
jgi:hypothetical protein